MSEKAGAGGYRGGVSGLDLTGKDLTIAHGAVPAGTEDVKPAEITPGTRP